MRLEVQNIENLESLEKQFLVCPNHQSFLDPFVLCSTYDFDKFRNTFHVGASYFFGNRFMKWVAGMLQTVPVDPDATDHGTTDGRETGSGASLAQPTDPSARSTGADDQEAQR